MYLPYPGYGFERNYTPTCSYSLFFLTPTETLIDTNFQPADPSGTLEDIVSFLKVMFRYGYKLILCVLEFALMALIMCPWMCRINGRFIMWKKISWMEIMILGIMVGSLIGAVAMARSEEIIE